MITAEKVEIFRAYKGYYDGYHIQNKKNEKMIADDEWILLNKLLQDIYLVRKGLAAKSFEDMVMRLLNENCDNLETCERVVELEKYLNEPLSGG